VTAVPRSQVASLRFLIDGTVTHIDLEPPDEFARHGHVLVPRSLGRGSHALAVDARLTSGRRLTAASTATVNERKAP
jgi:hypothetical protein